MMAAYPAAAMMLCAVAAVCVGGPAGAPPTEVAIVEPARPVAQLTGDDDRAAGKPTRNRTGERYKLWGTDLGVAFRHRDRTYLVFGDTVGPPGGDAIAWSTDRDASDGLDLTFISDGGVYRPVRVPGISQGGFEVPMAGLSVGGRMYIYHTTDHSPTMTMGRSVVARSDDDGRTFRRLYDLSRQHFINVSVVPVSSRTVRGGPLRTGQTLYLFGSGKYRASDVRLAYQPARDVEDASAVRYFAGLDARGRPRWSNSEDDAAALFSHPCVGELSVTYNTFLGKWLMTYNGHPPRGILLRTADAPWGPWSAPQVLFDPAGPQGYGHLMHVPPAAGGKDSLSDPGREAEWGGEYGPYQLPDHATGKKGATTIYFTMSTWNPYQVVLMRARLAAVKPGDRARP